jgi:CheW-like domain
VSLYLQIVIGDALYALDAGRVLEVRAATDREGNAARWQGDAIATVDLRGLFAEPAAAPGFCVLVAQSSGPPAALVVDRVDGLSEFAAEAFCPLPPIGALGTLIDAVATRLIDQRPVLRLRGERARAAAAALA